MTFSTLKHFNHLNIIFDSITDMIFLIAVEDDCTFRYINANEAAVSGSSLPNDFRGKTIQEVMPKDSADTITEKYKEAIELKQKLSYEAKITIPMQNVINKYISRYFESRVTPVFEDDGSCKHIIAITHDITERKRKEKELRKEKAKYELIFNHAADAVFTFDESGDYTTINPGFTNLFGWTIEELRYESTNTIVPDGYKEDLKGIFNKLKNGQIIDNHLSKRVSKEGKYIDVLSSYTPIMDESKMVGGVAIYKDITEMRRMTEQLRDSEQRYRLIADNLTDLIRVIDANGITLYASPSYSEVFGVSPEFFYKKSFLIFAHAEDMPNLEQFLESIVQTRSPNTVEFRRLHKGGDSIWMETKGTPVLDVKGNVERIILVSRDIVEQKEREEIYWHQANYDDLTGIPNRRFFDEQLDQAMHQSQRMKQQLALCVLDCDYFKQINDTYGHDVGDEVLKGFASRIEEVLGAKDIVSRMGGDEFCILIPGITNQKEAITIVKQIIKSIRIPFEIGEEVLHLTTSIGITFYKGDYKTKEIVFKQADEALYKAKRYGRDRFEIARVINEKVSFLKRIRKLTVGAK
jgi:diguanylate cyclase (GGDEF)-like protein/PAS domain S-box-containing protein